MAGPGRRRGGHARTPALGRQRPGSHSARLAEQPRDHISERERARASNVFFRQTRGRLTINRQGFIYPTFRCHRHHSDKNHQTCPVLLSSVQASTVGLLFGRGEASSASSFSPSPSSFLLSLPSLSMSLSLSSSLYFPATVFSLSLPLSLSVRSSVVFFFCSRTFHTLFSVLSSHSPHAALLVPPAYPHFHHHPHNTLFTSVGISFENFPPPFPRSHPFPFLSRSGRTSCLFLWDTSPENCAG